MKLIIDCGSTKADWVILNGKEVVITFNTEGFNPNYTDKNTILGKSRKELQSICTGIEAVKYRSENKEGKKCRKQINILLPCPKSLRNRRREQKEKIKTNRGYT